MEAAPRPVGLVSGRTLSLAWQGASNDRTWKLEWAETGRGDFNRGELTFHNFRNCDYGVDGGVTEHRETRKVHLRNLKGMDYSHDDFGGDLIAHPILSFDFGPDGRIALSVETRTEVGESYSEIGGFYKVLEALADQPRGLGRAE